MYSIAVSVHVYPKINKKYIKFNKKQTFIAIIFKYKN